MDVINDHIMDIGLNALGYLVAGGLGVLLHSAFMGRRRQVAGVPAPTPDIESGSDDPSRSSTRQPFEYVDLRQQRKGKTDAANAGITSRPAAATAHRDRREIIRVARQMLKAGAAGDQIRATLPISQSELALLQNTNSM